MDIGNSILCLGARAPVSASLSLILTFIEIQVPTLRFNVIGARKSGLPPKLVEPYWELIVLTEWSAICTTTCHLRTPGTLLIRL